MRYSDEEWQAMERCAPDTGEEFDWYALDTRGCLAVFTTGGLGPIPRSIWPHRNELIQLAKAIANLPEVTDFDRVFASSGNCMEWFGYACKGLYAFDYYDVHRGTARLHQYELIARPRRSVQASIIVQHIDLRWLPILSVGFEDCVFLSDSYVN